MKPQDQPDLSIELLQEDSAPVFPLPEADDQQSRLKSWLETMDH